MLPAEDKRFLREHGRALKQLIPFGVLGIVVPILLLAFDLVDKRWFIYGPITWVIALGIKSAPSLIGLFLPGLYIHIKNIYLQCTWEGMLSAIAELGLTIGFFLYFEQDLSFYRVLSFGLGIGFVEVLFITYLIIEDIQEVTAELKDQRTRKFILGYQLLERVLAIAVHLFSRTIIGISLITGQYMVFTIIVCLVFAWVDGWGGYIARKWDLEDPSVQKKIYLLLLIPVVLLGGIFFYTLV